MKSAKQEIESALLLKPLENLTELELRVLRPLFYSSAGNGHDFGMTDDNEVKQAVSNPKQLSGVISSLVKKGIIHVYAPEKINGEHWVTQFKFEVPPGDVSKALGLT